MRSEADGILSGWADLEQESGRAFLTEKLGELARRRSDLEQGLIEVNQALAQIDEERVTAETMRQLADPLPGRLCASETRRAQGAHAAAPAPR